MLWATAIWKALIATGLLAVASLAYRVASHGLLDGAAALRAAVPPILGAVVFGCASACRARRRAALVRSLRR